MKAILIAVVLSLISLPLKAQDVKLFQNLQVWNVFSMNARNDAGEPVDDRLNTFLRRARLGVEGKIQNDISYRITFAYDNIGKDVFTAVSGEPQGSSDKEFYLFDASVLWSIDTTWANLTLGFFRPQAGREHMTAAFAVTSFEKSLENFYQREYMLGRGSGREVGLNLGGLMHEGNFGINYNFGFFNPNHERIIGNGTKWSPLLAGRIALTIGDPEMQKYKTGYQINYQSKRRGITFAVNGTYQGKTDETATARRVNDSTVLYSYTGGFKRNVIIGADVLLNWDKLNIDAEYDIFLRGFSPEFAGQIHSGEEFADRHGTYGEAIMSP